MESGMKKLFPIALTAALILSGVDKVSAEPPGYDLMGFPITPHQASIVGSHGIQEQSSAPTLTLEGMPASPHQIAVLTPRAKQTAATGP